MGLPIHFICAYNCRGGRSPGRCSQTNSGTCLLQRIRGPCQHLQPVWVKFSIPFGRVKVQLDQIQLFLCMYRSWGAGKRSWEDTEMFPGQSRETVSVRESPAICICTEYVTRGANCLRLYWDGKTDKGLNCNFHVCISCVYPGHDTTGEEALGGS